jgi:hypothetical protein
VYPVEICGTFLALWQTAEEHQLTVRGELGEILTVQLPWRDPLSILWRAEGLNEHCATVVLLLAGVIADESEHLTVRRERRIPGLCTQLSFVALRSSGYLVRILPIEPDDKDRRVKLPIRRILRVGRGDRATVCDGMAIG